MSDRRPRESVIQAIAPRSSRAPLRSQDERSHLDRFVMPQPAVRDGIITLPLSGVDRVIQVFHQSMPGGDDWGPTVLGEPKSPALLSKSSVGRGSA